MVREGYSWFRKKNTKTTTVSAVLPLSDLLFLLRGQLQGSVRVRSMKVSTNQWHNYGSADLAIFDHLWVFEIVSGLNRTHEQWRGRKRRWKNFRKERKGGNDYFNLVFTYVIFNTRNVAISPKYNFEKLLRKLSISDFYWLKTYRVWCILLLMANPLNAS